MDDFMSLAQLNDDDRDKAYQRYKIIEPYVNNEQTLKLVSKHESISVRTLGMWIKKYREQGLVGLARQSRCDKGLPRQYESLLQKTIEGIYLKKPMLSARSHGEMLCQVNPRQLSSRRSRLSCSGRPCRVFKPSVCQ